MVDGKLATIVVVSNDTALPEDRVRDKARKAADVKAADAGRRVTEELSSDRTERGSFAIGGQPVELSDHNLAAWTFTWQTEADEDAHVDLFLDIDDLG